MAELGDSRTAEAGRETGAAAQPGRVRVAILTTQSVVTVIRMKPETASRKSVMCINRTITQTGVSRDYNSFVSAETGLIARLTGHDAFRTDVDGDVVDGRSWQLALYLAHRLDMEGRLWTREDDAPPGETWLATGEVDADLNVGAVSGVAEKIVALRTWLADQPDGPVRLFAPPGNRHQVEPELAALLALRAGLTADFPTRADAPFALEATSAVPRKTPSRTALVVAGIAFVSVVLAGGALATRMLPSAAKDIAEPAAVSAPASTTPAKSMDAPSAPSAPEQAAPEPAPQKAGPRGGDLPPEAAPDAAENPASESDPVVVPEAGERVEPPPPLSVKAAAPAPAAAPRARVAAPAAPARLRVTLRADAAASGGCFGGEVVPATASGVTGGTIDLAVGGRICRASVSVQPSSRTIWLVEVNGAARAPSRLGQDGALGPTLRGGDVSSVVLAFTTAGARPGDSDPLVTLNIRTVAPGDAAEAAPMQAEGELAGGASTPP